MLLCAALLDAHGRQLFVISHHFSFHCFIYFLSVVGTEIGAENPWTALLIQKICVVMAQVIFTCRSLVLKLIRHNLLDVDCLGTWHFPNGVILTSNVFIFICQVLLAIFLMDIIFLSLRSLVVQKVISA